MNEPASHGDERPLAPTEEDQSPISPNKATEPTSVQNSPLIPSDRGSLPSLPFHVAITDGGLEIEAKIKKEARPRETDKNTTNDKATLAEHLRTRTKYPRRFLADPA